MNYKEEIINAIADVCKRARREGYEEADSNQRENAVYAYERGLNDAWECARKIVLSKTDGGIGIDAVIAILGNLSAYEIFMDFTALEVITKINNYYKSPEKSQDEDEIKIGDEVEIPHMDSKGIIIATANKETFLVWLKQMNKPLSIEKHKVKKTGLYFPQINEKIKNMHEDE